MLAYTHTYSNSQTNVLIYHDPSNARLRIDDYSGSLDIVIQLIAEKVEDWVEKIIVKARPIDIPYFISHLYHCEGVIPNYFDGNDMYFLCKYLKNERADQQDCKYEDDIIQSIHYSTNKKLPTSLISSLCLATLQDVPQMQNLYSSVFQHYPTPIHDAEYIAKTIKEGTLYCIYRENDTILSIASAEICHQYSNAEITDCVSHPAAQGRGLMGHVITHLESLLKTLGINCLYSLSRALSFGMNKVFYNLDYRYGGRLINNCQIYSGLEDMNVWYKSA